MPLKLTPDFPFLDFEGLSFEGVNHGADGRKGDLGLQRRCSHRKRCRERQGSASIDFAQTQAVGVGVRRHLHDVAHHHASQPSRDVLDALNALDFSPVAVNTRPASSVGGRTETLGAIGGRKSSWVQVCERVLGKHSNLLGLPFLMGKMSLHLDPSIGCSSVGRYASGGRVVAGSNPVIPTTKPWQVHGFFCVFSSRMAELCHPHGLRI